MLRYFPSDTEYGLYAHISTVSAEEEDQLNNYISEGSTPSEQGHR